MVVVVGVVFVALVDLALEVEWVAELVVVLVAFVIVAVVVDVTELALAAVVCALPSRLLTTNIATATRRLEAEAT